ncbi:MAG TPA: BolA family transcriptional regulator [Deltaproteobacteria bacterium]|nr:MAG: hypothetical protein A2048_10520 [Deltaproteobacteria bacterium GWA2_45_12]HBF13184.1 BolA family transcriptional regulator [Deltaproteobacteria bacterium]
MAVSLQFVKECIEKSLPGSQVSVRDLVGDGDHLEALVVSEAFEGKGLLEQHKMVFNALGETMKADLHALKLKTYSPSQWEKTKQS